MVQLSTVKRPRTKMTVNKKEGDSMSDNKKPFKLGQRVLTKNHLIPGKIISGNYDVESLQYVYHVEFAGGIERAIKGDQLIPAEKEATPKPPVKFVVGQKVVTETKDNPELVGIIKQLPAVDDAANIYDVEFVLPTYSQAHVYNIKLPQTMLKEITEQKVDPVDFINFTDDKYKKGEKIVFKTNAPTGTLEGEITKVAIVDGNLRYTVSWKDGTVVDYSESQLDAWNLAKLPVPHFAFDQFVSFFSGNTDTRDGLRGRSGRVIGHAQTGHEDNPFTYKVKVTGLSNPIWITENELKKACTIPTAKPKEKALPKFNVGDKVRWNEKSVNHGTTGVIKQIFPRDNNIFAYRVILDTPTKFKEDYLDVGEAYLEKYEPKPESASESASNDPFEMLFGKDAAKMIKMVKEELPVAKPLIDFVSRIGNLEGDSWNTKK